jgi:uncharacterized membrane protein YdjX (TVP38/TMEM64 family)
MSETGPSRRLRPLLILVAVAAALGAGQLFRRHVGLEFSAESLRAWVMEWGTAAYAVFFLLMFFRIVILIPSVILLLAGGLCFGVWWTTVLGAGAILGSALVQFAVGRGVGRPWVRRWAEARLPEFERRVRSGGPLVVGLVTAHPAGVMTPFHWASGFSSMRLWPFAVAVGVGAVVRALSVSFFGAALADVGSTSFWVAAAGFAAIVLLTLAHPGLRRQILKG